MSPVPKPPIQDPDPGLPGIPQDPPIDMPLDPPVHVPQDSLVLHRAALDATPARPGRAGPSRAMRCDTAAVTA